MKKCGCCLILLILICPLFCLAQSDGGIADNIMSLQEVLETLKAQMLPKCASLIGVGRSIAGFAATWFIASRVWKHIAHAEPVDFYALLRPFAVGMAILFFPSVLTMMDKVLEPTVTGTSTLVDDSNKTVAELLKKKEEEMKQSEQWKALVGESGTGNRELWLKYAHPDEEEEGWIDGIGNDMEFIMDKMAYNFKNEIRRVVSTVLEIIYAAAALCINTLRTFNLIILAILGPLIFGISVFDGFHHTLTTYLARYVNIYLWLPVANILSFVLGGIQENMLKMDLSQIANGGQTFFNSYDLGYMIFMVIGIIAYTTVPSICDQIIHVGGGGALQGKTTQFFVGTATSVVSGGASAAVGSLASTGGAGSSMVRDSYGSAAGTMGSGMAAGGSGNYFKDKVSGDT